MPATRPIYAVLGRAAFPPKVQEPMKALDQALSDAKYKKVHSFRKRGLLEHASKGREESRRDTLSSRLALQASVVKGREVLQIGSPSERVYIVFPLKEPQKFH